jgi:hypothetical protein
MERVARKLTDGEKDETVYRVYRTDFEDPFLDDSKPVLFSAYGDKSKKFGYFKYEKNKLDKLLFEDDQIGRCQKQKMQILLFIQKKTLISRLLYLLTDNFAVKN